MRVPLVRVAVVMSGHIALTRDQAATSAVKIGASTKAMRERYTNVAIRQWCIAIRAANGPLVAYGIASTREAQLLSRPPPDLHETPGKP